MVSVIIPALDEAPTIADVVALAHRSPRVAEVLVVDDGSTDDTAARAAAAGARVLTSTMLGKGASMEDGVRSARHEWIVFLDGDLAVLAPDVIERVTDPLLADEADFIKACFSREAGRVTTLTARPLLNTFYPELAHIEQPLGGIIAARRDLLLRLDYETDYGVDVALLLDAAASGARVAQVDIGRLEHDSQTLERLGDMATQVVRVILERAARDGRLGDARLRQVQEVERHAQAELVRVLARVGQPERLAVFDMDGTLVKGRFVVALAERTGRSEALAEWLDRADMDPASRTEGIARVLAGVARAEFEAAAREMPLAEGAVDAIRELRRRGYRVGVVSDSFRVATEIVRRRVFADFSVANLMRFADGLASGDVTHAPAMRHPEGCREHAHCKRNVLIHLREHLGIPEERMLAVGDGDPDSCMLRAAGTGVAFEPKSAAVAAAADRVVRGDLRGVLPPRPC